MAGEINLACGHCEWCARGLGRHCPTRTVLGIVQHNIEEHLRTLYTAKRILGEELIRRMDRSGEWTIHAQGVQVVAPSPDAGRVDWDAEKLDRILDELISEGIIDRSAKQRAIKQEVTLKVDKRGVAALCKIPAARDAISEARIQREPQERRASVRVDARTL